MDPDPDPYLRLTDPGGLKNYGSDGSGSGSGTMVYFPEYIQIKTFLDPQVIGRTPCSFLP
jgi:hypothetical protein